MYIIYTRHHLHRTFGERPAVADMVLQVEQIGSFLGSSTAVNVGGGFSLLLPTEAFWRRVACERLLWRPTWQHAPISNTPSSCARLLHRTYVLTCKLSNSSSQVRRADVGRPVHVDDPGYQAR